AAAAPVVLAGLATVLLLSLLVLSPWPRWNVAQPPSAVVNNVAQPSNNVAQPPSAVGNDQDASQTGLQHPGAGVLQDDPSQPGAAMLHDDPSHPGAGVLQGDAAVFWQALLDALARPEAEAPTDGRRWPTAVAIGILLVVACGLARLVLGVAAIRRERLRSQPVGDAPMLELIDVLRAELGCRREVELRECDSLATAATIGWRRPVLLVPADWPTWTEDERRAVLAHELAHVRGYDCVSLLLSQMGLAMHFYHPLVHWLAGRLRLEQELAADAAAAGVSGGQRAYLMTIARLALRGQDRPLAWPARTFLPTRTTFLRRIAMLRDSKLRFERISPMARAAVVGVVLVAGLLAAGLRGPGWPAQARAEETARAPVEGSTIAPTNDAGGQIDMSFIPSECRMFLAVRPADALGRPEMAGWVELLGKLPNATPKGKRLVDFRQITVVQDIRGPRVVVVFQSVEPIAAAVLLDLLDAPGANAVVKEVDGRKMYVGPNGRPAVLQYDDRTIIGAGTEQAMRTYLAGNLGTLPRWLPKETGDTYRADHAVVALNPVDYLYVLDGLESIVRYQEDRSPYVMLLQVMVSLPKEASHLIAGLRVDDAVRVHATAVAKDVAGAEAIEKTVDAARVLARNMLKEQLDEATPGQREPATQAAPFSLLNDSLDALRISREGTVVRAQGSISMARVKQIEKSMVEAQEAAERARPLNNLKTLAAGVLYCQDAFNHFPPGAIYGRDGKPPHSWRVAILPYIEQQALYEQYCFDEPWDSPANLKVLEQMPDVFRSPTEPAGSTNACYFALTGPETVFGEKKRNQLRHIRDGLSNTLMLVEAKRDIPWTKPEDIPYAADKTLPKLGGFFEGVFNVAFCDGAARTLPETIPEKTLRALITKAGGEPVSEALDAVEVKR
ncbi:MAG: DUF1559 domain-containing protein, partial [Pirellulaceae bacterium]|nr:DUF1559 domain-containing protein [Pirellulaceae bacterium]